MPGSQALRAKRGSNLAEELLQHVAGDAGTGVDGGEDEEGLEHDGVVVPVAHERLHAGDAPEIWAMPTARETADLRGLSDRDTIAAMLNIADSRFQEGLLARAKAPGKIESAYEIPGAFRNNTMNGSRKP